MSPAGIKKARRGRSRAGQAGGLSEGVRDVLDDVFELLPDVCQPLEPPHVVGYRAADRVRALRVVVSPVRAGALDVQDGLVEAGGSAGEVFDQIARRRAVHVDRGKDHVRCLSRRRARRPAGLGRGRRSMLGVDAVCPSSGPAGKKAKLNKEKFKIFQF